MGKQDPANSKLPNNTTFPNKQENTITLKVLIHCEGCKRKVKRIIKCVDGVDSVNIEAEYGKVTVVGSGVDAKAVVHSLHKAGKHAEIWQFGGGKVPNASQGPTTPSNNNNSNVEKNKMKGVGVEKLQDNKNNNMNTNMGGGKGKGGEMIELANVGPSSMVPPPKPPFPMGSGHFEKPNLPTNNVAILSKSVAPKPSIHHGGSSYTPPSLDNSEYASADYATHLFSDENANNCSVM